MIRIAHIADSHLDEHNRLEDNLNVHRHFLEDARSMKVDLILHAGDLFERASTPRERNGLADFLLHASGFAPVVAVKGNHDADADLDIFQRLHSFDPEPYAISIDDCPGNHVIRTGSGPVCVLTLPWFDKSHLCASAPSDASVTQTTDAAIRAARNLLDTLRAEAHRVAASGGTPVLVAHLLVAGSVMSTGQTLIGRTVELAPDDLADVGCAYVALGHIHKHQHWGNVVYSGSTQRNNYGEPEAKGWVYVEIDPERVGLPGGVRWQFIELPARKVVLLECDMVPFPEDGKFIVTGAAGHDPLAIGGSLPDLKDALVRLRYRVRPEDLHRVDEAWWRTIYQEHHGAHEVKLEAVLVHEARVRSQAITTARDTWDKLVAYWQAAGIDVPEAQRARLRAKLDEIEKRARAEATA